MSLKLDVAGIRRIAGHPATRVLIDSSLAAEQVMEVVHSLHPHVVGSVGTMTLRDTADVHLAEGGLLTTGGVVIGINPASYSDFEGTLERWRASLEAAGLVGTIKPYVPEHPPHIAVASSKRTDNLIAAMVFAGHDAGVGGARQVRLDAIESFLERAIAWASAASGDIFVCHGLISSRASSVTEARRFFEAALALEPLAPVSLHWAARDSFRTLGWDLAGHAWLQDSDVRPWRECFDELALIVEASAPDLIYALLRLGYADVQSWVDAIRSPGKHLKPPGAGYRYVSSVNNDEENQFVPDAYGAQLLGPAHLDRVADATAWDVAAVDERLAWVRAQDLAEWFTQGPSPARVDAARASFGEAILSREQFRSAFLRERDRSKTRGNHDLA